MDYDGTKAGFDIDMLNLVSNAVNIPVIASGGAGPKINHFVDVFKKTNVDAALAASIFHYDLLSMYDLKEGLKKEGIETRRLVK